MIRKMTEMKKKKKMLALKRCLLNNVTSMKRFGVECEFIVNFLKVIKNK
jgi:hypothetical protein